MRKIYLLVVIIGLYSCNKKQNTELKVNMYISKVDSCLNLCDRLNIVIENNTDINYYIPRYSGIIVEMAGNILLCDKIILSMDLRCDSLENKCYSYDGKYMIKSDTSKYPDYEHTKYYEDIVNKIFIEEINLIYSINKTKDFSSKDFSFIRDYYSQSLFIEANSKVYIVKIISLDCKEKSKNEIQFVYTPFENNKDSLLMKIKVPNINQNDSISIIFNNCARDKVLNKYYLYKKPLKSNKLKISNLKY